jgi:hypothetical protein
MCYWVIKTDNHNTVSISASTTLVDIGRFSIILTLDGG